MSYFRKILELSPIVEVSFRRLYYSIPWLVNRFGSKPRKATIPKLATKQTLKDIEIFLAANGVSRGCLLIVHSSTSVLTGTGFSPGEVLDRLFALIGDDGTLAMPAIPQYAGQPKGIDRLRADVSELEFVYDVKRSLPWTGMLPFMLMRRADAVRSRHPLNTMVAVGPLAADMMRENLSGAKPLPCGRQSSWKFCVDHKAIVVALGVDMAHSLTMIHVAEDSYEEQWPVKRWYRDRKFKIVDGQTVSEIVVRERHPKWAKYFAERTLSKDLKRAGILVSAEFDGIPVATLRAERLLEFLNCRKSRAYPYFMLPSVARKENESN